MTREEAAREIIKRHCNDVSCTDKCLYGKEDCMYNMAVEALHEPERKKGHWIILSSNEDSAVCKCSVCGEDFVFYNGEFFPNYCGDCGSDMREVRKNDRREEADKLYQGRD